MQTRRPRFVLGAYDNIRGVCKSLNVAAYCAVCERGFGQGESFALQGHHVVHRQCFGQRTVDDRKMDDIRQKIAALDTEVSRERAYRERDALERRREIDALRLEAIASSNREADLRRQLAETSQVAAGRRVEIANLLAAQQSRPAPQETAQEQPRDLPDTDDGTVIRFRLLEFE